ncbi:MAG: hypothetical protein FD145_629 [Candidatus Saganbacteria bacterium]|uniref:Uncharacterized protein n=1 Tax=Candidatus Saganbacteria bacterium TaxID=2575572 RepID=A0A833L1H0_UNCSA|nr:MAG: hypothetical protein FD145_629 [Candidatus Saganbacteria bacterium]
MDISGTNRIPNTGSLSLGGQIHSYTRDQLITKRSSVPNINLLLSMARLSGINIIGAELKDVVLQLVGKKLRVNIVNGDIKHALLGFKPDDKGNISLSIPKSIKVNGPVAGAATMEVAGIAFGRIARIRIYRSELPLTEVSVDVLKCGSAPIQRKREEIKEIDKVIRSINGAWERAKKAFIEGRIDEEKLDGIVLGINIKICSARKKELSSGIKNLLERRTAIVLRGVEIKIIKEREEISDQRPDFEGPRKVQIIIEERDLCSLGIDVYGRLIE